MSQERTFQLQLKNDQTIELKFTPIAATGDRLWQMFATTESLDMVEKLINQDAVAETAPSLAKAVKATDTPKKKK
jgi:hypothetical protein